MQFPFGVTFYPELWNPSELKEAFALIKKSGFNLVRFGEVSWGEVEPGDGKFDFTALDEGFKLAAKSGLKVLLGLGVSQAPQWLIAKHPEFRPVAADGTLHPEYGPRPNVCRDHPGFRKYVRRYVEKTVKRYAGHKSLALWQIDNEPNYPPLDLVENKDFCHCEQTRQAFAGWLKKRYGSLERLNAALGTCFWGGRFGRFAEIATPKGGFWDAGNPHLYLEWFRFKSERLSEWLKWLKGLVRRYDRGHPIGTNNFVGVCNRIADHAVLAQEMDYYGWDIYPKGTLNSPESLAEHADHWRGICRLAKAKFILSELQGGKNVRWGHGGSVKGEEIRLWSHLAAAHGAKGILYHALRPPLAGSETGGFGILGAAGEETERLQKIQQTGEEIKKVWEALQGAELKSRVAVVYLKSAEVQTYQEEGPQRSLPPRWIGGRGEVGLMHGLDSLAGAYRLLWRWQAPVDFLFEPNLKQEIFSYAAVLVPNPYLLDAASSQALLQFVRRGGVLITEARFGLKDELGRLRAQPLLQAFFSVKYLDTEVIEGEQKLKTCGGSISGFRDRVETGGAVESFEDGFPALILKKLGKGLVLYAAFSLFSNLIKHENRRLLEAVRKYLPSPKFEVESTAEVEVIPWEGEDLFFYVINPADKEAEVKIKVGAERKKAEDILSGFSCAVKQGALQFSLVSSGVRLLRVQ